jgi:DtxR family Mn-dependent transcriptional regulator
MATSTVEDYLKAIYLEQADPAELVPMGKLAAAMQVTPGTATSMVKALADSGLVVYEPRGGVKLTRGGEQLALHVLRRHRLVELFLVQVLGLDWSEVHAEAEELEHSISDKVLEKIDLLLGHPSVDPHGDPIPTSRGKVAALNTRRLIEATPGQALRVARVLDQNPEFLRFIERSGLRPGTELTIDKLDLLADAVSVQPTGKPTLTLGTSAAGKILVHVL